MSTLESLPRCHENTPHMPTTSPSHVFGWAQKSIRNRAWHQKLLFITSCINVSPMKSWILLPGHSEVDDHAKSLCNLQPQLLALKIAQDPLSLSKDSPIFAPCIAPSGLGPFADWSHVGASLICDEASLAGLVEDAQMISFKFLNHPCDFSLFEQFAALQFLYSWIHFACRDDLQKQNSPAPLG